MVRKRKSKKSVNSFHENNYLINFVCTVDDYYVFAEIDYGFGCFSFDHCYAAQKNAPFNFENK